MKIEEQSVMAQAISITSGGFCLCLNTICAELDMISLGADLDTQRNLPQQLDGYNTVQALQSRVRERN
jgi:hypothetical protein